MILSASASEAPALLRRREPSFGHSTFSDEQPDGLRDHPFATSADDPDSFFESRGHRQALMHVSHALHAGECFVVVTGEAGTGKSTLVRQLLEELDPDRLVAALPDGLARDARELLRSILSSFRAPVTGYSLDELRSALHAFLTSLAAIEQTALVVVDEAQDLPPDAIDELIDFASLQWTDDLPLQVVLVGQPALRINLPNMAQVERRPTVLFCDLGRLSRSETRAYVEHRLRRVEWNGSPSFSDDAQERIYRATEGVPQRVNELCDRLLMMASRGRQTSISPAHVDEAAASLREGTGGEAAFADDASHAAQPIVLAASANDPQASDAIVMPFRVDEERSAADVSSPPVFLPGRTTYELVPKIRDAITRFGWLAMTVPALVVAAVVVWPSAEKSVVSSLLANARGPSAGSATSGVNAFELARVGDPLGVERKVLGQSASRQNHVVSDVYAFENQGPRPLRRHFVGSSKARDEDKTGVRLAATGGRRGTDRAVAVVVPNNEARRVAAVAGKGETTSGVRSGSKRGKRSEAKKAQPVQQLASRTR
jgi:type II secretory pathway predicted ATPase ExeA